MLRIYKIYYRFYPPTIPDSYDRVLRRYFDYYKHLHPTLQKRFLTRLYIVLKFKKFLPWNGLPAVTEEMKIIIGSAIVQATFGLKHFVLDYFDTIFITPRRYRYRDYKEDFLGHVNFSNHTVCLSWEDVKLGYQIPNDAFNVALHEVAHTLEAEQHIRSVFRRFFNSWNWWAFRKKGKQKMMIIRNAKNQFLKNYGGTNMKELFAISLEAFFERPEAFKKEVPTLYKTMVALLQQDPTNKEWPIKKGKY